MDGRTWSFVAVAALLTVTPGADMAVVTKVALERGRRAALWATLGINAGVMAWAVASALGLAALLAASSTAFAAVKLAGAAYLVFLGLQAFRHSRGRPGEVPEGMAGGDARAAGSPFRLGLLTNLLNPKVGVFYATFLPQFIAPGDPAFARSVALAGLHNLMGLAWLLTYAWLVTRAGDLLRRPSVKRALDRMTGAVLIALGLRLAIEDR